MGNKDVTEAIQKVAVAYDCKFVDDVVSHQLKQFVTDAINKFAVICKLRRMKSMPGGTHRGSKRSVGGNFPVRADDDALGGTRITGIVESGHSEEIVRR
ncbi:hypothetical protein Tsubulata_045396, partial [Turnera subulata]